MSGCDYSEERWVQENTFLNFSGFVGVNNSFDIPAGVHFHVYKVGLWVGNENFDVFILKACGLVPFEFHRLNFIKEGKFLVANFELDLPQLTSIAFELLSETTQSYKVFLLGTKTYAI